jgi:hypothetical protein
MTNMTSQHHLITAEPATDYFAIHRARGKSHSFLCVVRAQSSTAALAKARRAYAMPRGSFASRIGREGYMAGIRKAFGA